MSYHTNNLTVAAALLTLGHELVHMELKGRQATFFFETDLSELALKIEMDSQLIRPIRLHQEIRRLSGLARSMAETTHV
jgi:hypothetical protein